MTNRKQARNSSIGEVPLPDFDEMGNMLPFDFSFGMIRSIPFNLYSILS